MLHITYHISYIHKNIQTYYYISIPVRNCFRAHFCMTYVATMPAYVWRYQYFACMHLKVLLTPTFL